MNVLWAVYLECSGNSKHVLVGGCIMCVAALGVSVGYAPFRLRLSSGQGAKVRLPMSSCDKTVHVVALSSQLCRQLGQAVLPMKIFQHCHNLWSDCHNNVYVT
jgi:hypothetical protein